SNGQILGINVGVLEVTDIKKAEKALRESEEKLNLAITGAEAGMWFWDLKNNNLEWTDRCNTIFGIEKDSEISYDLFLNVVHPNDRGIVNNAFEKSLHTVNELKLEIRLLWPDGSLHWAYLLGTVYPDSEGNPKEMMGIVIDISDRKSIEAELRKTLKQLKRSNAELEQFAYVASHDLQEPLRMITSFLQLLQRRYENQLDSDADEFIHFAVDGATRMQELINDLLTYSRVGRKTGKIEDVDSEALIEQILFDSKVLIEETNTSITYNDLPLIRADYTQMAQVFQNLIGNAIKYQENAYPEIHITAKKNGKDWIFKVEDNGIGIDPKHGERVFRIFQRLHGRDEYEGTGIGLAIVKRIIEQHGGMIWYESAPGKGSKFYFTIPQGDDPR
ncbi:MAG: PAS domain-containing protein, partial [Methanobacterium sp.]|nr:PAS domain-containing protein [Methanobacterium sp.]